MDIDHANHGDQPRTGAGVRGTSLLEMRASDADREATAELLRQHYATGRLHTLEFEERISRCFAATTVDQLRELVADLPRGTAWVHEAERARGYRRLRPQPMMLIPIVVAVALLAGLVGVHALWLVWPLAFIVLRGRFATVPARSTWLRRQG
jgi:hypothetical protein